MEQTFCNSKLTDLRSRMGLFSLHKKISANLPTNPLYHDHDYMNDWICLTFTGELMFTIAEALYLSASMSSEVILRS